MSEAILRTRLYLADRVSYSEIPQAANGNPGIVSANGRVTDSEGYAEGTIILAGVRSDYPSLLRRRRIEHWAVYRSRVDGHIKSDLLYRGTVKRITPSKNTKGQRQLEVKVYGIWSDIASTQCMIKFANTGQEDRCVFFAQTARKFVCPAYASRATGSVPGLVVQANPVGSTPSYVDAYDISFGDFASGLQQNLGQVAMGGDAVPVTGEDRLFFRPYDDLTQPATHTLSLPDIQGGLETPEEDSEGQATVLVLKGGPLQPNQRNLLADAVQGNTSFESPQIGGDGTAGNFILNYSFENGGSLQADHWAIPSGGTGAVPKNSDNKNTAAATGNRYLECDHVGENAEQDCLTPIQPLVDGTTYTIDCMSRVENSGRPLPTGAITVQWYSDHAGTTLLGTTTVDVLPIGVDWTRFGVNVVPPTGSVGFKITVSCVTLPGTPGADGIDFDDVRFFNPKQVTQLGWEFYTENAATAHINSIRWDADLVNDPSGPPGVYHHSRCVFLDVTSVDVNGQDCKIQPIGQNRFNTITGQELLQGYAVYVATGDPPMLVHLIVPEWKKDGSEAGVTITPITISPANHWQIISTTRAMDSSASAQATSILCFRSSGRIYIDAGFCYDSNVPVPLATDPTTFVEGGTFEQTYRADAGGALTPTYGSAIYNEAIAVGDITAQVTEQSVLTPAEGDEYAAGYMARYALPLQRPTDEWWGVAETNSNGGSTATMMPGESVRVIGTDGADLLPNPLPLVEKTFDWTDGKLSITLYLSAEPRDPSRVVEKIMQQNNSSGLSASSGSGSAALSGSSGSAGAFGGLTIKILPSGNVYRPGMLVLTAAGETYDPITQTLTLAPGVNGGTI